MGIDSLLPPASSGQSTNCRFGHLRIGIFQPLDSISIHCWFLQIFSELTHRFSFVMYWFYFFTHCKLHIFPKSYLIFTMLWWFQISSDPQHHNTFTCRCKIVKIWSSPRRPSKESDGRLELGEQPQSVPRRHLDNRLQRQPFDLTDVLGGHQDVLGLVADLRRHSEDVEDIVL